MGGEKSPMATHGTAEMRQQPKFAASWSTSALDPSETFGGVRFDDRNGSKPVFSHDPARGRAPMMATAERNFWLARRLLNRTIGKIPFTEAVF